MCVASTELHTPASDPCLHTGALAASCVRQYLRLWGPVALVCLRRTSDHRNIVRTWFYSKRVRHAAGWHPPKDTLEQENPTVLVSQSTWSVRACHISKPAGASERRREEVLNFLRQKEAFFPLGETGVSQAASPVPWRLSGSAKTGSSKSQGPPSHQMLRRYHIPVSLAQGYVAGREATPIKRMNA